MGCITTGQYLTGYVLAVIYFLTLSHTQGQTNDLLDTQPVLNTHRKDLRLSQGDNATVRCTGNSPVAWQLVEVLAQSPPLRDRMSITNSNSSGMYESELYLRDLMYADTGRYVCYYENGDILATSNVSIYIYVFDPEHLLAPPNPDFDPSNPFGIFQLVHQGTPAVIPCRPTSATTNMQLIKGPTGMDSEVTLGDDLTFDPEEGFTLTYPNSFYNGIFNCRATQGNFTQDMMAILSYKASTAAPQPELEASHTNVLVGENMTFRCYVRVAQGVIVYMDWSYSSNEHSDRIRQTPAVKQGLTANGYNYDEIESTLTVRDVRLSDRGVYQCTVTNHDGKSASRAKSIHVIDKTFVYLTPMEPVVEVGLDEREVYLTMQVYAYPPPLQLIWYKDGNEILLDDRHYDLRIRSDRAKLKIYDPTRADAGVYVLEAYSPDMNTSQSITLHFIEPPEISITAPPGYPYYMEGSQATLRCQFNGFPTPVVMWNWQPCDQMGCQPDPLSWVPVTESRNIPDPNVVIEEDVSMITVLSFRQSGFYQCVATNKMGTAESHEILYVTDIADGFGITREGQQFPIEGDEVEISCHGNSLNFLPPQMYWMSENKHILLTNRSGMILTSHRNDYSEVMTLTLTSIAPSDAGLYYCQTEDSLGQRHRRELQVYVRPQRIPQFTKALDGTIYLKAGMSHTLECNVNGLPLPVLTWYLDGEEVVAGEKFKFNANKTRLTLESVSAETCGIYKCEARNRVGTVSSNMTIMQALANQGELITLTAGLSTVQITMIVGIIFGIVLLSLLMAIVARRLCLPHYYPDEYLLGNKSMFNPDIPIDEQTESIPYDPRWEFPQDRLNFGILLGQGAFGKVVKAEALGISDHEDSTIVAVKMPREFSDVEQMKMLVSELKVLIHVGHHLNIVNLLGACTKDIRKGVLYVIQEYCRHGNLRSYLHHRRNKFIDTMDDLDDYYAKNDIVTKEGSKGSNPNYVNTRSDGSRNYDEDAVTKKDIVCYSFQIARGMEYLASRKYIHRDLAARNILLANDNVVKIADFGLAKDCYKYDAYQKKTDGPVPVKWMALESLTHKIYTSRSDVWSFGILLWELFTVGGNPYPGLEIDEFFVDKLKHGYRMQIPQHSTPEIYQMMMQCWSEEPDDRPNFSELAEFFGNLLQASVKQHYIDLNTQYLLIQDSSHNGYLRMQGSGTDYIPMINPGNKSSKVPSDTVTSNPGNVDSSEAALLNQTRRSSDLSQLELVDETQLNNNDSPKGSRKKDLAVSLSPNGSVETTAVVHLPPKSSPTDSDQSQDDDTSNLNDPFLSRSDSERSERELGLRRGRKGYKCNDSLTSDTSSGFHSDYIPDDSAPPEYNSVMLGAGQGEVMI